MACELCWEVRLLQVSPLQVYLLHALPLSSDAQPMHSSRGETAKPRRGAVSFVSGATCLSIE
eukprot:CAMPEP_0183340514 /NCGR_PEP_ID=MMETSP0164_2-20130417/7044_1 /TAXON_ID=221442 /ORGANISM="Coccolithus pelagicus ssp braarudi, Strain PLY182g" /LENGTH=61 /DNA_ID=CAMNT_0025510667 /DNA_START=1 /DNA_END=186 /DNA_ORIENTATION=+